jgi:vanillin dehydrogenase
VLVAKGIIGGEKIAPPRVGTYERRDIVSGAVLTTSAAFGVVEAEEAANAAAAAFDQWSNCPAVERAQVLRKTATILLERSEILCTTAAREIGAAVGWVNFNIKIACAMLEQAATLTTCIGETSADGAPEGMGYSLRRIPAGVVLGIAPWNAPITLAVRAVAAPLALGNTVVLKGSELCPKTHEIVAQTFLDAGLPSGVLNYVANAPENAHDVVATLIAHPAVRRVNFTGSTRVGREVAVLAAKNLKPCLLELSGKATTIVLSDADLDAAARAVAHGAFFNQGQICMSTDRVIVDDSIADAFVSALHAEVKALHAISLGEVISSEAVLRLHGLVDDALTKGAVLVTGATSEGAVMQPTVLDRVSYGMRVYEEEIFGPIVGIVRVSDAEEAVTVANDTEFGLAAAVLGKDLRRARQIARQIEAGVVHVNGSTVYDDPQMPLGGMKASGYGRFGGLAAIEEFTEIQWITEREKPAEKRLGT